MPAPYATVFQITKKAPDLWFACIGLIPLVAGLVSVWGKRRYKWSKPHWLFAFFLCLFGTIWVAAVGTTTVSNDVGAFEAYQKGDYQIVEGMVTDFQPMPYQGHQDECFSVQNQRFCYSDYTITPGFHNATSHGGLIHEGLPVRVAYRDGTILRLEIPVDQALSPVQAGEVRTHEEHQWQQQSQTDPILQRMNIAFLFTGLCWTAWWNLQWQQAMRFWIKPPYHPWAQYAFRTFFAACFCGTAVQFTHELMVHPVARRNVGPTVLTATAMCIVVGIMTALSVWIAQRRDRRSLQTETHHAN